MICLCTADRCVFCEVRIFFLSLSTKKMRTLGSGDKCAHILKHTGQASFGSSPTLAEIMFYLNDRLAPTFCSLDELPSSKCYYFFLIILFLFFTSSLLLTGTKRWTIDTSWWLSYIYSMVNLQYDRYY